MGRQPRQWLLWTPYRGNARHGIAAAGASAQPHFPSEPDRTHYAANVSTYRGEQAFSLGLMHRIDRDTPFAITAGFSTAGGKDTVAKVGVAGEL